MMRRLLACGLYLLGLSMAQAAGPTQADYFGLHIHRADQGTAWPAVPFGSWRLWDASVSWDRLEPQPRQWDFSRLDRYVAMAALTRTDVLMPLANTPRWAAARPDEPSGYKPGNASEPADLGHWDSFVQAVGERYKGRIRYYEIWNEPDDKTHFTGSLSVLIEMTCRAHRILKQIDPDIRVVSPATAGGGGHIDFLDRFLTQGGKACVDIIAHHFYVPRFGPEAMVPHIRQVRAVMERHRLAHLPLWNTESGWWIENADNGPYGNNVTRGGWRMLSATEAADAVVKSLLLARGEGVDRFYWYAWDNGSMGFLEADGRTLKPAAAAWRRVAELMRGKSSTPCQQTAAEWRCELKGQDGWARTVSWPVDATALLPREGKGNYPAISQIRGLP